MKAYDMLMDKFFKDNPKKWEGVNSLTAYSTISERPGKKK
jgi:hypothetical protein